MSLTREVAEFIVEARSGAVPAEVRRLATRSILDGIGVALAGSVAESGRIVREHLAEMGCDGPSTVIGSGLRAALRSAALANGVAMHADDYDDTQLAATPGRAYGLLTHPTAPVLPALLAWSERDHRSGAELLDAYLIGTEVEMKIAEAIDPRHYGDGFHTTGTVGAIGAAAALARLLRFDVDATMRVLGVAASMAAGLRESFGTMTKPLHAGRAAESGVVAADLVRRGWTAATTILEAPRGFFRAAGGGFDPALIEGKLGAPWCFSSPGVSIKPHPSGVLTHPGMAVMADLVRRHDLRPERVKRVRVGTNRTMATALLHHRPRTGLSAKFSLEFGLAILIAERRAGLAEYTDAIVRREDVGALIERIEVSVHPEAEAAGYDRMTTLVDVELTDGTVVSGRASFPKGSPAIPMTDADLEAKLHECAAWAGLPIERAASVVALVWGIAELRDVNELTACLRT